MLNAGRYYVGDLCYVLTEDNGFDWQVVLDATGYLGLFEPGTDNRLDPDEVTGYFRYNGVKLFSSTTASGDGSYCDKSGRKYSVDAGVIGCFPMSELPEGVDTTGGQVVEFKSDLSCWVCDKEGDITIGDVTIKTGDKDEDDQCDVCGSHYCGGECDED